MMENYSKGKNEEESWEKERIPIAHLPEDFLWMKVSGGSKMSNLLEYALREFKEAVVWSGSGAALGKTVSCAEIMKRQRSGLYQINKICYRTDKEFWDPKLDSLDPLVVVREVPTIHILLSSRPLDVSEPGYQVPNSDQPFHKADRTRQRQKDSFARDPRVSEEQFTALGLRSSRQKKPHKNKGDKNRQNSHQQKTENWRSSEAKSE